MKPNDEVQPPSATDARTRAPSQARIRMNPMAAFRPLVSHRRGPPPEIGSIPRSIYPASQKLVVIAEAVAWARRPAPKTKKVWACPGAAEGVPLRLEALDK